jgi:hypothetical protein
MAPGAGTNPGLAHPRESGGFGCEAGTCNRRYRRHHRGRPEDPEVTTTLSLGKTNLRGVAIRTVRPVRLTGRGNTATVTGEVAPGRTQG